MTLLHQSPSLLSCLVSFCLPVQRPAGCCKSDTKKHKRACSSLASCFSTSSRLSSEQSSDETTVLVQKHALYMVSKGASCKKYPNVFSPTRRASFRDRSVYRLGSSPPRPAFLPSPSVLMCADAFFGPRNAITKGAVCQQVVRLHSWFFCGICVILHVVTLDH